MAVEKQKPGESPQESLPPGRGRDAADLLRSFNGTSPIIDRILNPDSDKEGPSFRSQRERTDALQGERNRILAGFLLSLTAGGERQDATLNAALQMQYLRSQVHSHQLYARANPLAPRQGDQKLMEFRADTLPKESWFLLTPEERRNVEATIQLTNDYQTLAVHEVRSTRHQLSMVEKAEQSRSSWEKENGGKSLREALGGVQEQIAAEKGNARLMSSYKTQLGKISKQVDDLTKELEVDEKGVDAMLKGVRTAGNSMVDGTLVLELHEMRGRARAFDERMKGLSEGDRKKVEDLLSAYAQISAGPQAAFRLAVWRMRKEKKTEIVLPTEEKDAGVRQLVNSLNALPVNAREVALARISGQIATVQEQIATLNAGKDISVNAGNIDGLVSAAEGKLQADAKEMLQYMESLQKSGAGVALSQNQKDLFKEFKPIAEKIAQNAGDAALVNQYMQYVRGVLRESLQFKEKQGDPVHANRYRRNVESAKQFIEFFALMRQQKSEKDYVKHADAFARSIEGENVALRDLSAYHTEMVGLFTQRRNIGAATRPGMDSPLMTSDSLDVTIERYKQLSPALQKSLAAEGAEQLAQQHAHIQALRDLAEKEGANSKTLWDLAQDIEFVKAMAKWLNPNDWAVSINGFNARAAQIAWFAPDLVGLGGLIKTPYQKELSELLAMKLRMDAALGEVGKTKDAFRKFVKMHEADLARADGRRALLSLLENGEGKIKGVPPRELALTNNETDPDVNQLAVMFWPFDKAQSELYRKTNEQYRKEKGKDLNPEWAEVLKGKEAGPDALRQYAILLLSKHKDAKAAFTDADRQTLKTGRAGEKAFDEAAVRRNTLDYLERKIVAVYLYVFHEFQANDMPAVTEATNDLREDLGHTAAKYGIEGQLWEKLLSTIGYIAEGALVSDWLLTGSKGFQKFSQGVGWVTGKIPVLKYGKSLPGMIGAAAHELSPSTWGYRGVRYLRYGQLFGGPGLKASVNLSRAQPLLAAKQWEKASKYGIRLRDAMQELEGLKPAQAIRLRGTLASKLLGESVGSARQQLIQAVHETFGQAMPKQKFDARSALLKQKMLMGEMTDDILRQLFAGAEFEKAFLQDAAVTSKLQQFAQAREFKGAMKELLATLSSAERIEILNIIKFSEDQAKLLVHSGLCGRVAAEESAEAIRAARAAGLLAEGAEAAEAVSGAAKALRYVGRGALPVGFLALQGLAVGLDVMEIAEARETYDRNIKNIDKILTGSGFRKVGESYVNDRGVRIDVAQLVTHAHETAGYVKLAADAGAFAIEAALLAAGAATGPVGIIVGAGAAAVVLTVHVAADAWSLSEDYKSLEKAHPFVLGMMGTSIVGRKEDELLLRSFSDKFLSEASEAVKKNVLFALYVQQMAKEGRLEETMSQARLHLSVRKMLAAEYPAAVQLEEVTMDEVFTSMKEHFDEKIMPFYKAQMPGKKSFIDSLGRPGTLWHDLPGEITGFPQEVVTQSPSQTLKQWNEGETSIQKLGKEIIGENWHQREIYMLSVRDALRKSGRLYGDDMTESNFLALQALKARKDLSPAQRKSVEDTLALLGQQKVYGKRLEDVQADLQKNQKDKQGVPLSRTGLILQSTKEWWDAQPADSRIGGVNRPSLPKVYGLDKTELSFQDLAPYERQLRIEDSRGLENSLRDEVPLPSLFAVPLHDDALTQEYLLSTQKDLEAMRLDLRGQNTEIFNKLTLTKDGYDKALEPQLRNLEPRVALYLKLLQAYKKAADEFSKDVRQRTKETMDLRQYVGDPASYVRVEGVGEGKEGRYPSLMVRDMAPEGDETQAVDRQVVEQFVSTPDALRSQQFRREDIHTIIIDRQDVPGGMRYSATYVMRADAKSPVRHFLAGASYQKDKSPQLTFTTPIAATQRKDISQYKEGFDPLAVVRYAECQRFNERCSPFWMTMEGGGQPLELRVSLGVPKDAFMRKLRPDDARINEVDPAAAPMIEEMMRTAAESAGLERWKPLIGSPAYNLFPGAVSLSIDLRGKSDAEILRAMETLANTFAQMKNAETGRNTFDHDALMIALHIFAVEKDDQDRRDVIRDLAKLGGTEEPAKRLCETLERRPAEGIHVKNGDLRMAGRVLVPGWKAQMERDPWVGLQQLALCKDKAVQRETWFRRLQNALEQYGAVHTNAEHPMPDFAAWREEQQKARAEEAPEPGPSVSESLRIAEWPKDGKTVQRVVEYAESSATCVLPEGEYAVVAVQETISLGTRSQKPFEAVVKGNTVTINKPASPGMVRLWIAKKGQDPKKNTLAIFTLDHVGR